MTQYLDKIIEYCNAKFPFNERVYHIRFYIDKKEYNDYISICVSKDEPLIRIYEGGEETHELYMSTGRKIKIQQHISNIDEDIKKPDLEYIFNFTKNILDKYSYEEIMINCFSNYHKIPELKDDIKYKIRDLQNKVDDYKKISKYVSLTKEEQEELKKQQDIIYNFGEAIN